MNRKKWTEIGWTAERRSTNNAAREAMRDALSAYLDGAIIRFADHDNHQWRVGRAELYPVLENGLSADGMLISFGHDQFLVVGDRCFEEAP